MSSSSRRALFAAALCSALVHAAAARSDEPPAHVHGGGDASDAGAKVPEHQKHPLDPRAPKPTGKAIDLEVGTGTAKGYVARPNGKVQGGILVLHESAALKASASGAKDVSATFIYYGLPATDVEKLKTLQGPILGIYANQDGWITK